MHVLRWMTVGIIIGLAIGCAHSHGDAPDWFRGHSDRYPSDRYLLGVGEGPTRAIAEERAYAAVAKIFQADVQVHSEDVETYSLRGLEGAETHSRSLALRRSIRSTTHKVLDNVAILDVWYREADRHYVVLAGLDRRQGERMLLDRLVALDRSIEQAVMHARTGGTLWERVLEYRRALRLLTQREALNGDLRVIRSSGEGVAARYRTSRLQKELESILTRQFVVALAMEGPFASDLRQAVLDGLVRAGMLPAKTMTQEESTGALSDDRPSPHLLITGRANIWDVDIPDPLFRYARWCAQVRLTAPETRTLVGAFVRAGREGHITSREARGRARRAMQASVSAGLVETLSRYVDHEAIEESDASGVCPQ